MPLPERIVAFALGPLPTSEHLLLRMALRALERRVGPLRRLIETLVLDRGYWGAQFLLGLRRRHGFHFVTRAQHEGLGCVKDADALVKRYRDEYATSATAAPQASLREQARIEAGLRAFLESGGFSAFTTTFEDLHGLEQLPGLAVQRLMVEGYGFGAEGDWKTAALIRALKVAASGLPGGTSFMEDYTYHLEPGRERVLGAHMLEVCASIAAGKPSLEVHPLGIGGKADPARLVFGVAPGPALNASLVDLGNRFRLIVNAVDVVAPDAPLPKLPTARAVWVPRPNLKVAAAAWIHAGGAHHTAFSQALTPEHLEDYAEMAGIELVLIDESTSVRQLKKELRWNEAYYHLANGL